LPGAVFSPFSVSPFSEQAAFPLPCREYSARLSRIFPVPRRGERIPAPQGFGVGRRVGKRKLCVGRFFRRAVVVVNVVSNPRVFPMLLWVVFLCWRTEKCKRNTFRWIPFDNVIHSVRAVRGHQNQGIWARNSYHCKSSTREMIYLSRLGFGVGLCRGCSCCVIRICG